MTKETMEALKKALEENKKAWKSAIDSMNSDKVEPTKKKNINVPDSSCIN